MKRWTIRNLSVNTNAISQTFGISEVFSTVLANRNLLTRRALDTYLNPDLSKLYDILQMKDVENAFNILKKALTENKKIYIYGDYDVDGVTSTVILYKSLKNLSQNIFYYIPDREHEGYGLNAQAIHRLKEQGCQLIFTCDNGIASVEEVEIIKELGMQVIILDHHEPRFIEDENGDIQDVIPLADAVIDTKRKDCNYTFKHLCTGGLSYKFVKEFYNFIGQKLPNEDELLVFASISTICDIVDLVDENRIIAKKGIEILNNKKDINLGLFEIIKQKGILEKEIDEVTYGFVIGPCINASGRLESALKAVELFTTDDENKAFKLASELTLLNEERKELTSSSVMKIIEKIENSPIINDKILVIYDPEIHESIAGIVAGRIKEIYFKPTIIITKGKDVCKGSGRSIPTYNIFESLLEVSQLFTRFGGHPMAVGLSIQEENIDILRRKLNENTILSKEDMTEVISIDKELNFSQVNLNLAEEISSMKPLGKENKTPMFATKNVYFKKIDFIGKEKNILKVDIVDNYGVILKAISFNLYDKLKIILEQNFKQEENEKIFTGLKKSIDLNFDIVYSIEVNNYNNLKNVQINIKDLRIS